jgi:histidine triad (HIT) family protein
LDGAHAAAIQPQDDDASSAKGCAFCRIVAGEASATIVHRDDHLVAFRDINPVAPTHILIIPTRHISSLNESDVQDQALLGAMVQLARSLAETEKVAGRGYRLVINTGPEAGQSVSHLHAHLLAGRRMHWPPG